MSDQPSGPAAGNMFERIKRVSLEGNEFWSARDLARTLEYSEFRHFAPVIEKAREACLQSHHRIEDHFEQILDMVNIGSGAQRPIEDWALSRYTPENLPAAESIKMVESRERKRLKLK